MSFFADFVGGAAKTLLDERKIALAERLRKEEEQRRQDQRIVATSYDPDRRKIFESLASGETREIDMPEAMQQDLIRQRVMGQREQLLKDADRERGLAAQAKKEASEAKRLELDERRTAADIGYKDALSAEAKARAEAMGQSRGPNPGDVRALDKDLRTLIGSIAEDYERTGVPTEIQEIYRKGQEALRNGNMEQYYGIRQVLEDLKLGGADSRQQWLQQARGNRGIEFIQGMMNR